MFPRIRFLPIMIFSAVLLLSVKVSNIWQGVEGLTHRYVEVASASAQTAENEGPVSLDFPEGEGGDLAGIDGLDEFDAEEFILGEDTAEKEAEKLIKRDPTLLTQAEIELLQRLATRRDELDAREYEMEQRDVLLQAAEERINNKIVQLQIFKETIDDLIVKYDAQQEQKMLSLVKIYENMKPKDAARIFEELDMPTLLSVIERMKERKLSEIMAKMAPETARNMTVELSKLRVLPEADSTNGG